MNKIAIICPYFGKLPLNINVTINSMKNNNFIDWYILTDDNYLFEYDNIFFIKYTFNQMRDLISNKIGTSLYNPYKLCDYKVTYGYLFEEILKKYDFWGYCDLDIIFGDLSKIFNSENLNKYQKILDKGHISIYKNIEDINKAFMYSDIIGKDYRYMLDSKYIYCFDERYPTNHLAINEIIERMGYNVLNNTDTCIDIDIKYNNFYNVDDIKIKNLYFEYKNKKLFIKSFKGMSKEITYVHLQKRNIKINLNQYDSFFITPKSFFYNREISKRDFYLLETKFFWYIKFRIQRKIKNVKRDRERKHEFLK